MLQRKILVTGGTGFLGTAFLKMMASTNDNFVVISRNPPKYSLPNIQYVQGDLANKNSLLLLESKIQDATILIDLAAMIPSNNNPKKFQAFLDANFNDHLHLLDCCPNLTKIIYASTIDVYGFQDNPPFTEEYPTFPSTDYGATKLFLEHYYRLYANQKGINLSILRFTQIYGPNEPEIKVIPIFVNKILANSPLKIVGTGEDLRGYLYIDDAANSIQLALNSTVTGIYNVAGDEITSLNKLTEILGTVTQKDLVIERVDGNPPKHYYMDNSKIKRDLAFVPKFTLAQGLKEVLKLHKNARNL